MPQETTPRSPGRRPACTWWFALPRTWFETAPLRLAGRIAIPTSRLHPRRRPDQATAQIRQSVPGAFHTVVPWSGRQRALGISRDAQAAGEGLRGVCTAGGALNRELPLLRPICRTSNVSRTCTFFTVRSAVPASWRPSPIAPDSGHVQTTLDLTGAP